MPGSWHLPAVRIQEIALVLSERRVMTVASCQRRTILNQFESQPKIDNDGYEFQRVYVKTLLEWVGWFTGRVDGLHWETGLKEVVTHDAPHDREIGGPTTKPAVRGVGQEGMGTSSGNEQSDRPGPRRVELRLVEDGHECGKVASALGWNTHFALAPEPLGLLGRFAKGCSEGLLTAK
jgi:hypothetical protein